MLTSFMRVLSAEESASSASNVDVSTAENVDDSQPPPTDNLPGRYGARKILPAPAPERSLNIWSFLKTCIGKELTKISMPVSFNEPISLLQRITENMEYAALLEVAAVQPDALTRMLFVAAFQIAGNSSANGRYNKPFNPVLGETYELARPELCYRWIAEQVSHHPPVSAFHGENDRWEFYGSTQPKLKFWGKSIEVKPTGVSTLHLKKFNEIYTWSSANVLVHNIVVGKLWSEFCGTVTITCHESGCKATLTYKPSSSSTSKDFGRLEGVVENKEGEKKKVIFGKSTHYICVSNYEKSDKKSSFSKRASSVAAERSPSVTSDSQQRFGFSSFRLHPALSIDANPSKTDAVNTHSSTAGNSVAASPAIIDGHQNLVNNADGQKSQKHSDAVKKAVAELAENANSVVLDACDENVSGATLLWAATPRPGYCARYYNMTEFAMGLNALEPENAAVLPRSDARFRSDMRCLEEGDIARAASEKERIEMKQRTQRKERGKDGDDDWHPLWFERRQHSQLLPGNTEQFWMPKGTYWNRVYGAVPDLF